MGDLVKTALIGTMALAGVWATVKIWPLSVGSKPSGATGELTDSASVLLDLLPGDVVNKAKSALETVEAEVSAQVAKRVAVGVFAGVLVGVAIAG